MVCFKNPFGAVKTNEKIRFMLFISDEEEITEVRLIFRKDTGGTNFSYSMTKEKKTKSFFIYSQETSFEKADLYFYRFEIDTKNGTRYVGLMDGVACIGEWLPEWQLTVYSETFETPSWVKGAIMYQIFPDRFRKKGDFVLNTKNKRKIHKSWDEIPDFIYETPDYKANDFFGGNIRGVIEMIPYLKKLNIDVIYFNPIFESAEYHRYSTGDYFKIDPYFGTNDEFKNLCELCTNNNIKIILDGVFSHTGADSIYFNKFRHYDSIGAFNANHSPYFDWYTFKSFPNEYESWWGFENLPNVNEENPEYLNFITGNNGVISYWQSLGVQGWRLDVADELPDLFLDSLYASSKAQNKNAIIIGEVWEDASHKNAYGKRRRYLLGGQMDGVMNYPWRDAILDFVQNADSKKFHESISVLLENYPEPAVFCLMNSISTHDTPRAITCLGVNHSVAPEEQGKYKMTDDEYASGKQKLLEATFLQFTLPGIPCIYYGDEVGLYGFRDPYCRMTYPYGREDFSILDFYIKLSKVRKNYSKALSSPLRRLKAHDGLYMFQWGNLLFAINVGCQSAFLLSHIMKIEFIFGNYECTANKMYLLPHSMIIICLSD